MIGRTPVAAVTCDSHVWAQAVRDAGSRPLATSKSSTGTRSPDVIAEFRRNQLASLAASLNAVSGLAKWYDPTARPAPRAPERFAQYAVSAVSVPAVARTNAKRLPAAATCDHAIGPWW